MGLEKQGSEPTGLIGKIIGRLMNKFQTALYIDYFKNELPPDHSKILDIGCGGGKFLAFLFLANDSYSLYGLDHSPEMVALSKKVNKKAIERKRLEIIHGSVPNLICQITETSSLSSYSFPMDLITTKSSKTLRIINH